MHSIKMTSEQFNSCEKNTCDALNGWTKEEKFSLLQGLKEFGSHDLETINSKIPTKTSSELIEAIDYYKKRAIRTRKIKKGKRMKKIMPQIPLASWAKLITDTHEFNELHTETATALRLIAEFENIPASACTENIDFKKIYHIMANALDGKTLPYDKLLASIIDKCIVETALISKTFISATTFRNIVNSENLLLSDICLFPKPTVNNELACLRHLLSQKSYNPLNIPERYLKSCLE